jgi:ribulose-5-phosphate 4-epimerase/fuculose-1-phosphate aldolase
MSLLQTAVNELVDANTILYAQGVVDGFGHVSMRHPTEDGRFLLSRSKAPATVVAQDILVHDLTGEPVDANGAKPYLERFIHSEIYRQRPDVMAVVHSHSPAIIPFGCVPSVTLRPLYHMAGFLGAGTPCFDIADKAGDATDMLIRDAELGAALSQCLGDSAAVLMRGHGSTTVGTTLRQAVFRAIYAEINARLQTLATSLGEVKYLSLAEAENAARVNDANIDRAWDLWVAQLGQRG